MLKRNARATKAKRPMTAFGRFILPLAAVMAIALFFFSAKLFFLTSNERDYYVENSTEELPVLSSKITEDEPIADVKAAAIAEKKDMPVINITKKIDQAPVKKKKEEQKIIAVTKKTQTTEENKINKKQETAKANVTEKAAAEKNAVNANVSRWDIQTGGFTSKESALALLNKLNADGFKVYVIDSVYNGSPFYKVRVKGSIKKEEARKISSVLAEKGYPVYVVLSEPLKK